MSLFQDIETEQALGLAFDSALGVLFKHSTVCPISAAAFREMEKFARHHADVPVFIVDVRRRRALSQRAADHFGIDHESPQAILFKDGKTVWHASHMAITADSIEEAINGS